MTIELILITAFVIVTFLFLQIVKIRRPQAVTLDEEKSGERMDSSNEDEFMEVSVLDENATLK